MTMKPCLECGEPTDGSRCAEHRLTDTRRNRPARPDIKRNVWIQLSRRARRIQPWCEACGTPDELQADHSPRAWARTALRLPLRLCDVTVLCRGCNVAAGSSMEDTERYTAWALIDGDPRATGPDPTIPPKRPPDLGGKANQDTGKRPPGRLQGRYTREWFSLRGVER